MNRLLLVSLVALGAPAALAAQAPVAPQRPAAVQAAPARIDTAPPPAVAPRPPRPLTQAQRAAQPPVFAGELRAPATPGLPVDSIRRVGAAVSQPLPPRQQAARSTPPAPGASGTMPAIATPAVMVPATPPNGATMQCKDGTFLTGTPAPTRCAGHGGSGTVLPAAQAKAPPPRQ